MPNTAPTVRASAETGRAMESDRLILRAGAERWAVPAAEVLCIADPPADVTPIPHAPAPVAGLIGIEGCAVTVLDLTAAGAPGGALVVVASGTGGLALLVDSVGRGADPAPPLAERLAACAPWAPPPAAGRAPVLRPVQAAAPVRRVPLLLVDCGGTTAALPVARVDRVGVVSALQPLRGSGALVRVDGALLPARRLADALPTVPGGTGAGETGADGARWAVVLRGEGRDSALLVDRVVGLEPCDARSITTVTPPGGRPQRWLNRPDADPMPVMDEGSPPPGPSPDAHPPTTPAVAAADVVLTVQAGDLRLALPLGLVDRILESGAALAPRRAAGRRPVFDVAVALGRRATPRAGTLVRVRTADGIAFLLSVDRMLALAPPAAPWQPVEPLPPVAALAFDAAGRDGAGWLFRLRRDPAPPATLPMAARRALAAARLGWADDPDTPA